jgi:phosphosulfolactate synthase
VWNCPGFLDLPAREQKPRRQGITHVLDKGLPTTTLEVLLTETGHLIDVLKIGWGIGYVDRMAKWAAP